MAESEADRFYSKFTELGEAGVREKVSLGQYAGKNLAYAETWLNKIDQSRESEDRDRSESSNREQMDIARSAKNAAWTAAIAAIIAAVSAIIAFAS